MYLVQPEYKNARAVVRRDPRGQWPVSGTGKWDLPCWGKKSFQLSVK